MRAQRTVDNSAVCLSREMNSPVGRLAIHAEGEFLLAIDFVPAPPAQLLALDRTPVLLEAERQLLAYFSRELNSFDLPLMPRGTAFQLAVWEAMLDIPFGQTRTYGELAEAVGGRNKARAVGQAANKNPLPIVIPCHRVIGAGNTLTGFGSGIDKKAILLNLEQGANVW